MKNSICLILAFLLVTARVSAQTQDFQPHIGYFYPAGGQQGSVFEVVVGGQYLRNISDVHVTGSGVQAKVIQHYRPFKPDGAERRELQARLYAAFEKQLEKLPNKGANLIALREQFGGQGKNGFRPSLKGEKRGEAEESSAQKNSEAKKAGNKSGATNARAQNKAGAEGEKNQAERPPADHPLLRDLENKNLRELQHVVAELLNSKKRQQQQNMQISESVVLQISIDQDAVPGDREVRLEGASGLSNPMLFQVGTLPETRELEPNEKRPALVLPVLKEEPLNVPILLNGQIKPGDVDRFRFRARKGQRLVMEVQARNINPYLADAVPGWFQATLALYDPNGKEIAFVDDYRFNPDPVLSYQIPENGEYELEVRDSIYRGREDFVYRILISERPFVTQIFPLGAQAGTQAEVWVDGWNLNGQKIKIDTQSDGNPIRQTAVQQGAFLSNPIVYAVDTLPEIMEIEPNDSLKNAQPVTLPQICNGRIQVPGDTDLFLIQGRAGEEVVAEIYGRRLNSSLDSLLRVMDTNGTVLEMNDDREDKGTGLQTHHADSYLRVKLPANGAYYIQVSDSQGQGAAGHAYRLHLTPPRPDFALRVTPSSISVPAGSTTPITVHALRKDGYDGAIDVVLADGMGGFKLSGGSIPAGRDSIRMTLSAPSEAGKDLVRLRLEGRAQIAGKSVSHPVTPAEDMMQAFLPRHLVPMQELLVSIRNSRLRTPSLTVANAPVLIPTGGTTQLHMGNKSSNMGPRRGARRNTPMLPQNLELELKDPPKGVTLETVKPVANGYELVLKADSEEAKAGMADNLIFEAFAEVEDRPQREGKAASKNVRRSLGVLPAVPIQVVQR